MRADHRRVCQVIDGARLSVALTTGRDASGCGGEGASAPADAFLAADAGAFLALGGEYVGVARVGVTPAQVAVQGLDLRGVAAVVGVGQGELQQRVKVGFDRVGPGGVGRGEAQLDLVLRRPAADVRAPVGGEVVQDDVVGAPSGRARESTSARPGC